MPGWKRYFALLAVVGILAVPMAASADEGDKIAVFKLKGPMPESPGEMDMSALLGSHAPVNMFDLLQTLRRARGDADLRAVVFDIEEAALGLAQIQELRAQFDALRAADKDVLIYAETLHVGTLLLGSSASRLVMMPKGMLDLSGLYSESLYFKNLLDKIGVEADIIHCGAFKSAGEPFYRTGPSEAAEQQTNSLLDSIYEQIIADIAESRHLSPETVSDLIDKGLFHPDEALEAKLVDALQYRGDFVQSIRRKYGRDTEVVRDYGKKGGPEVDLENPFAIFKLLSDLMKGPTQSDKPTVAVVYVEGSIVSGESEPGFFGGSSTAASETIRKAIAKAARDESVKALVLRVNSPGGSAIASEVICEATKRFKQSGRPFLVSMGNVAASGGYYVSTLADAIYAEPSTITGSIGVVGGKIVTKGLWDWAGVTGKEYKRGAHADIMNTNRKFSDEERELIQSTMNRVYGEFKARVTEGRADRIEGEVDALAGGRVYTGEQALEKGLVDRLGGLADAIKKAADEADLGSYEVRVFPQPKTIFDLFAEAFGGQKDDDGFVSLRSAGHALGAKFGALPAAAGLIETVRHLDPAKARVLENFLIQLDLLSEERVLLIGPASTTWLP